MFTNVSPLTLFISFFFAPLSCNFLHLNLSFSVSFDPNFSKLSVHPHVGALPILPPPIRFLILKPSACPLPLMFYIPKASFSCFLSLSWCIGELKPSFGITEPSSCPTRSTTVPSPPSIPPPSSGAFHLPVSHVCSVIISLSFSFPQL